MTSPQETDILTSVKEFVALSERVQDPELDDVLLHITRMISKPDVPPDAALRAIVKLEALAAKFAFAQSYYKTFGKLGKEEQYKKDLYYTARDATTRLVDSLKYVIRANGQR